MSDAAFLNTIRANPADDTTRPVYADWLDEQGGEANAARAEFIRVQVELARLDETDPSRPALEDRENELLRANESKWLGKVPKTISAWKFERGFLAELVGTVGSFSSPGIAAVCERHPVSRLRINDTPEKAKAAETKLPPARWLPTRRGPG